MDEIDDGFISSLVKDGDELISSLGIDTSTVRPFSQGSQRYRSVSDAYEKLNYAQKQSRSRWDTARAKNGRSGEWLMQQLWQFKDQLKNRGEDRK